jgi:hypothetical protein
MTKKANERKLMATNTQWIGEHLLALNMNQRDLSGKIDLDPGAMSRTIAGRRRLQISEANKIALIFKCTLLEVLHNFGIETPGGKLTTLPIIGVVRLGGSVEKMKTKDSIPVFDAMPDSKAVVQVRDSDSEFDGWVFYLGASTTEIEMDHLAILHLSSGKWHIGVAAKGYVPGRYNITLQNGEKMEDALIGMQRVLAIIPI